jgi:hypothetical protein
VRRAAAIVPDTAHKPTGYGSDSVRCDALDPSIGAPHHSKAGAQTDHSARFVLEPVKTLARARGSGRVKSTNQWADPIAVDFEYRPRDQARLAPARSSQWIRERNS